MYASVTSYADIYDQAYRDRRGQTTSFEQDRLPALLVEFVRAAGLSRVLDVSGGQGALGRMLRQQGIATITTDLEANPSAGILALDLSSHAEAACDRVRAEVAAHFDSQPYVTSCFDVLEHIDIEHVLDALRTLHAVTWERLVVSISTRPSVFGNRFHSTLLPMPTWRRLFAEAGFRVVGTDHFRPASIHRAFGDGPELELINRWRTVDLLDDIGEGEPRYLVLEKAAARPDWVAAGARMRKILDVDYRTAKRRQFVLPETAPIHFNLGFAQDWALFRPLLDVLPRANVRFLVRPLIFSSSGQLNAVLGFLTRTGVQHTVYDSLEELPWRSIGGTTLVSAIESTADPWHLRSHHLVAMARLHGCRTITLQHGIWPGSFKGRVLTYAAEHLLNWTTEEERALSAGRHDILGVSVPWAALAAGQVKAVGSARYTDQLLEPGEDLVETRLGVDRSRFERVVLLGTKNLKNHGYDNMGDGFYETLQRLLDRHRSTLFLLRPHPYDDIARFAAMRRPHVRILDDVCCTVADLQMNRLMPHLDLVATPMSTLAIDAAVSDKPVFVYKTDRPLAYKGITARAFDGLSAALGGDGLVATLRDESRALAAVYADAVDARFYERLSEVLVCPKPREPPDPALAATVSLCHEVEQGRTELLRMQAALHERTEQCEALRQEVAALRADNAELASRRRGRVADGRRTLGGQASRLAKNLLRAATRVSRLARGHTQRS